MAKILCIEDEPAIREDIAEALELAGHTVIQAANGAQGLQAILREKPDLTLSDIAMPEMNGLDMMCAVREFYPEFADMPFVLLSARVDRADQIMGRALGADEYLTKPVDFELMQIVIISRLNQVRRMRQLQSDRLQQLCDAVTGGPGPDAGKDSDSIHALFEAYGQSAIELLRHIGRDPVQ